MNAITIDDLQKIEIRIGKILSAERVEGSEKLLKLSVDLGEALPRQILSGVAKAVTEPAELIGKMVPIVANLAPRMMMGLESNGMMLCADSDLPVFLHPAQDVVPGALVK
jgi:methionine--tRNA ligase beta chain